ncbi:hypothetical protein CRUP_012739 [Coryphaenoides rupestris]|nr:hypothetical protein CRUP_012739 [Coryphaenoides rupestris]
MAEGLACVSLVVDGVVSLLVDGVVSLLVDGVVSLLVDGVVSLLVDGVVSLLVDGVVSLLVDGVVSLLVDGVVSLLVDGVVSLLVDGVVSLLVDGVVSLLVDGVVSLLVDGVVSLLVDGVQLLKHKSASLVNYLAFSFGYGEVLVDIKKEQTTWEDPATNRNENESEKSYSEGCSCDAIRGNSIRSIPAEAFNGIQNLEWINLGKNRITSDGIAAAAFRVLEYLKNLDFPALHLPGALPPPYSNLTPDPSDPLTPLTQEVIQLILWHEEEEHRKEEEQLRRKDEERKRRRKQRKEQAERQRKFVEERRREEEEALKLQVEKEEEEWREKEKRRQEAEERETLERRMEEERRRQEAEERETLERRMEEERRRQEELLRERLEALEEENEEEVWLRGDVFQSLPNQLEPEFPPPPQPIPTTLLGQELAEAQEEVGGGEEEFEVSPPAALPPGCDISDVTLTCENAQLDHFPPLAIPELKSLSLEEYKLDDFLGQGGQGVAGICTREAEVNGANKGCVLAVYWSVVVSKEGDVTPQLRLLPRFPETVHRMDSARTLEGAPESFQSLLSVLGVEAALENLIGGHDAVVQTLLPPHAILGLRVQIQDGGGEGEGCTTGNTTRGPADGYHGDQHAVTTGTSTRLPRGPAGGYHGDQRAVTTGTSGRSAEHKASQGLPHRSLPSSSRRGTKEKYPSVVSLAEGSGSEVMNLSHPQLPGCVLAVYWSVVVSKEGDVTPQLRLLPRFPETVHRMDSARTLEGAPESFQSLLSVLGVEAALENLIGGHDAVVQTLLPPHAILGLRVQIQDGGGEGEGCTTGNTTRGPADGYHGDQHAVTTGTSTRLPRGPAGGYHRGPARGYHGDQRAAVSKHTKDNLRVFLTAHFTVFVTAGNQAMQVLLHPAVEREQPLDVQRVQQLDVEDPTEHTVSGEDRALDTRHSTLRSSRSYEEEEQDSARRRSTGVTWTCDTTRLLLPSPWYFHSVSSMLSAASIAHSGAPGGEGRRGGGGGAPGGGGGAGGVSGRGVSGRPAGSCAGACGVLRGVLRGACGVRAAAGAAELPLTARPPMYLTYHWQHCKQMDQLDGQRETL